MRNIEYTLNFLEQLVLRTIIYTQLIGTYKPLLNAEWCQAEHYPHLKHLKYQVSF